MSAAKQVAAIECRSLASANVEHANAQREANRMAKETKGKGDE